MSDHVERLLEQIEVAAERLRTLRGDRRHEFDLHERLVARVNRLAKEALAIIDEERRGATRR